MCICLTVLIYSPNLYAEEIYNNLYEVSLQRSNEIEVIELPSELSETEVLRLKNNILLYGNDFLTEEEVEVIKQNAEAKGGLVYGSWFGGYDEYYAMSLGESLDFINTLLTITIPFLVSAGVVSVTANNVVTAFMVAIGSEYVVPSIVEEGEWVKADMRKRYREVSYSDGTFAYFETGFFANNLSVAGQNYGSPEAIFSGGMY